MPARKKEAATWWPEPEASSASGGLITPTDSAVLDPLGDEEATTDEPSERSASDGTEPAERTDVIPRAAPTPRRSRADKSGRRTHGRSGRSVARRTKMTLRHVDPLSVLKLSLMFYGCLLLFGLVIVAILYTLLASAGMFDAIEKLGETAVLWEEFDISLWFVERWALLIGLVLVALGSLANVFLAVVYNVASDVVGGAQMTFVERDV
jgi:hypothetical protein